MFTPLIASHRSGCRVRLTAMDVTPTRVRFLGSGDAFGSGGRFQACIHVRSQDSSVLLDCGASSLIAMRRFGVEPNDIDAILVSHLHGDHFGGIPFFILDGQFLSKRERSLLIAGPPGIEARVRQAQETLFSGSSQTQQKYEIGFLEWHDRRTEAIAGTSVTRSRSSTPAGRRRSPCASRSMGRPSPIPATPSGRTPWSRRPKKRTCSSARRTSTTRASSST